MSETIFYRGLGPNRYFPERDSDNISKFGFRYSDFKNMSTAQRLEGKLIRHYLLTLFKFKNLSEVQELFNDEIKKEELNSQIINRFCEMLNIGGSSQERQRRIYQALRDADSAISYLTSKSGIFGDFYSQISMINEVSAINRPIDLLLLIFSPKATPRTRFEARRKLLLAESALKSSFHREQIGSPIDPFLRLLNTYVWANGLIGDLTNFDILSEFDPETFACTDYQILEPNSAIAFNEYQRLVRLNMRKWKDHRGNLRYVMLDHRIKDQAGYILKMIRKNTREPSDIDDAIGLSLTFLKKGDIHEFLMVLQSAAIRNGSMIRVVGITDTIENHDKYHNVNPGSSPNFEVVKVHLEFDGVKIELMMHTIRTYLDYLFQDGISWVEYELNRVTQIGKYEFSVAELLFPYDIYEIDWHKFAEKKINNIRSQKRSNYQ